MFLRPRAAVRVAVTALATAVAGPAIAMPAQSTPTQATPTQAAVHAAALPPAAAAPATAPTAARSRAANLILVPHPDDEFEMSTAWEFSPDVKVFVFLTDGGGSSAACVAKRAGGRLVPAGYDAALKEWLPPAARTIRADAWGYRSRGCVLARQQASVSALRAMRRVDPSLPALPAKPSRTVTLPGVGPVTVYDGGAGGMALFLGLRVGALTSAQVTTAVNAVTAGRARLRIPATRWKDLVGAAYYSTRSTERCLGYPHPDHGAVHQALRRGTFRQFTGVRKAAGCRGVDGVARSRLMDRRYVSAVLRSGGIADTYYGWLASPRWRLDRSATTTLSVFARHQAWWQSS